MNANSDRREMDRAQRQLAFATEASYYWSVRKHPTTRGRHVNVYSKVLCGKYNNRVGLKRCQRWNSDGLANIFESDNQFNKGFLSFRILRTNCVAHETHSEISIMRQSTVLMHIWTNILNNKTASIYGGPCI